MNKQTAVVGSLVTMLAAGGLTWLARKCLKINPQWQGVIASTMTLIGLSFTYRAAQRPRPPKASVIGQEGADDSHVVKKVSSAAVKNFKTAAFTVDDLKEGGCNVTAHRPLNEADLTYLEMLHKKSPIKTLLACDPNLTIDKTENLLNRFKGLEGFGNRAPHLGSLEELSQYLALFAIKPNDGKAVLRALHIQAKLELSELEPISAHLPLLYHLFIDSHEVWNVDLGACSSLETISLPRTRAVSLGGCSSLVSADLPAARVASLQDCSSLQKANLPLAKSPNLRGCSSLVTISLPGAREDVYLHGCSSLEKADLPVARVAYLSGCSSLVTISLPQTTERVYLDGCSSLVEVNLPLATEAHLERCTSLVTVSLPVATEAYLDGCSSLEKADLPAATYANLNDCSSLETISLPQATRAHLRGCTSLVELSVEQLPRIETLVLGMAGGGLPRGIEQLTTLKMLDLSRDPELTGLPEELLTLPSTCIIDLTGTGISDEVLERLRARCNADDYNGPRISHSVREVRREGELSIEKSLERLCKLANIQPLTLQNIPNDGVNEGTLRAWLNRVSYIADYKSGGETQKQLAKNILGYLQLADESEEFRASFGLMIEQAVGTCGDRMAYYLLFLDLDARLLTMDLQDTPALADFLLKGYWQVSLLEECARQVVAELPLVDEIEVYLGYPVKLKERLQIPIDIEEMLYFSCSALTEEHLDAAATYVETQYVNEEARLNFLIDHPKWLEALKLAYPEDLKALKETRDAVEEDYVQAAADYNKGLRELTKKAL